jgi:hypothetical protein
MPHFRTDPIPDLRERRRAKGGKEKEEEERRKIHMFIQILQKYIK